MKKIFAILILIVYLFNLAGYTFLYNYFISNADITAIQQLDKNQYDDRELVEVKLPLHLPYMVDMSEFERYDGSIENNGIHYNYVKRKLQNDTLYILCLPNYAKTQLTTEKNNYAREVNDIPVNKKNPAQQVKKNIGASEYNQPDQQCLFNGYSTIILNTLHADLSTLPNPFCSAPAEPPDHNC